MAINPETQFPGKIAPSSSAYPYGEARNITSPGDGTGTPFTAPLVNDDFGYQQAALSLAGVVPSGTPDRVGASQYLQAQLKNSGLLRADYAALRAVTSSALLDATDCIVSDALTGGVFRLDKTDTTTADDGGITIVDTDGGRWKRQWAGSVALTWFGATGAGATTDDTAAIQNCFDYAQPLGIAVFAPKPAVHYEVRSTLTINPFLLRMRGDKSLFKWGGAGNDPMFDVSDSGVGGAVEFESLNLDGNNVASIGLSLGKATGSAFVSFGAWVKDCFITKFTDYGIDTGVANASAGAVDMRFFNNRIKLCGRGMSVVQPSVALFGGQIDDNTECGIFIGGNGFIDDHGVIYNNNGTSHWLVANLSRGGSKTGGWQEGTPPLDFINPGPTSNDVGNLGFYNVHFKVNAGQQWLDFTKLNECSTMIVGCQISSSSADATITLGGNKTILLNLTDASGLYAEAGNTQFLHTNDAQDVALAKNGKYQIRKQDGVKQDVLHLDAFNQTILESVVSMILKTQAVEALKIRAEEGRGNLIVLNEAASTANSDDPQANAFKIYGRNKAGGLMDAVLRFPDGSEAILGSGGAT